MELPLKNCPYGFSISYIQFSTRQALSEGLEYRVLIYAQKGALRHSPATLHKVPLLEWKLWLLTTCLRQYSLSWWYTGLCNPWSLCDAIAASLPGGCILPSRRYHIRAKVAHCLEITKKVKKILFRMEIIKCIFKCHHMYSIINTNNYFEKQTMTKICMCLHFVFTVSSKVFSHYCTETVSILYRKLGG